MQEIDSRSPISSEGGAQSSATREARNSAEAHVTQSASQLADAQAQNAEMLKWQEMMDIGIRPYMRQHPEKFHRRVRRGIPAEYRWEVWKAAVQYDDQEVSARYDALCKQENQWSGLIRVDVPRTFPEKPEFDKDLQESLYRVLNAYANHNPEVGYCQGMNFVVGLLLLVSSREEETFGVFVCLMDHDGLCGFYKERLPLLRLYLKACDRLVADVEPELRDHFIRENVQPAVYLHQWFLTLFINCFPLSMVTIIWDVIICDGLPVILLIAVSILQVLKDSLLAMCFEDIIKFFKMMKTYDDEDGEFNAYRIGRLLMKHTEHVELPEHVLEIISRGNHDDMEGSADLWEREQGHGRWFRNITKSLSGLWVQGQRRRPHRMVAEGQPVDGADFVRPSPSQIESGHSVDQANRVGAFAKRDTAPGAQQETPATSTRATDSTDEDAEARRREIEAGLMMDAEADMASGWEFL